MKRILVALDFSGITAAVLESTATLAAAFGARVWLLHVAPPEPDFIGFQAGPASVRDQVAHELRDEHRELAALAETLNAHGLETTPLLVAGAAVGKIVEHARRLDADLIVIGSHGHGALYRAVLGSVSEGVVRRSKCPVLVVPHDARAVTS